MGTAVGICCPAQRHHRLKSEQRTKLRPTSPNQRQREQGRQRLRRVQSEEPPNLRHKRVGLRLDESAQNRGHRGSADEGVPSKVTRCAPWAHKRQSERAKLTYECCGKKGARSDPGSVLVMPPLCVRRSNRARLHNAHECEFPSHDPPTNRH